MYLTHVTNAEGQPVFILALPFEQRAVAGQAGFTWNSVQPNAWATTSLAPVKNLFISQQVFSVAPDTLDYIKAHTSMTDATYEKYRAAYTEPTRKEWAGIYAAILTDEQIRCIHEGLQYLASVCDGAMADDRAGFNRNDLEFGHSMAAAAKLSPTQAGFGKLMLKKYRGQLGEELYASIFPELVEADRAAAEAKRVALEDKKRKKAEKEAPKLHKKGLPCEWSLCPEDACIAAHMPQVKPDRSSIVEAAPVTSTYPIQQTPGIEHCPVCKDTMVNKQPSGMCGACDLEAPMQGVTSVHLLHEDGSKTDITHQPERWLPEPPTPVAAPQRVQPDPDDLKEDQIYKLAMTLATCHPGDFDTTVDLLRNLREIDKPKKAGSDFAKAAWQAAGYKAQ